MELAKVLSSPWTTRTPAALGGRGVGVGVHAGLHRQREAMPPGALVQREAMPPGALVQREAMPPGVLVRREVMPPGALVQAPRARQPCPAKAAQALRRRTLTIDAEQLALGRHPCVRICSSSSSSSSSKQNMSGRYVRRALRHMPSRSPQAAQPTARALCCARPQRDDGGQELGQREVDAGGDGHLAQQVEPPAEGGRARKTNK